jgi:hypothetical protein|tara:strand:- start:205 stop:426 length:222 start_codon:yes stop_codon:yes gene_type:complete
MSEDKEYFKKGVEYYFKFNNDDPIKFAESTEDLSDMESIERSTLKMEVGPWDGSEISWKIGMKKFKIYSKEKE